MTGIWIDANKSCSSGIISNKCWPSFTPLLPSGITEDNVISTEGAVALISDHFLIFDTKNSFLYYDADGSGDGLMIHIATLNVETISHTSFDLVA